MRIVTRTVVALLVGCLSVLSAQAQSDANAGEQQLFISVNRVREAQGLRPLRWSESLGAAAHAHAAIMAEHGAAEHGFAGEPGMASRVTKAGARFVSLSENVAMGNGVEAIESEFLHSPNHRANLLDPDMDSIGVGVVKRGGQIFAVEDFSKAR
jgi:uncharacterized protein YkwD